MTLVRNRLSSLVLALLLAACGSVQDPVELKAPAAENRRAKPASPSSPHWLTLQDYGGFKILYDCSQRTPVRYEYVLTVDTGNTPRPSNYTLDPTLPPGCGQQTSTGTYASVVSGWDRGHLVTSNHLDYNSVYMTRANYMTNIVPQVASFNEGIWVSAENVAECYRDIAPVTVYGGVVYSDPSNDHFLVSHGVPTPDFFWKVIVTSDPTTGTTKVIGWYIPNKTGLGSLNSYIVSVTDLERLVGRDTVQIDLPEVSKNEKPTVTWPLPAGCSFS